MRQLLNKILIGLAFAGTANSASAYSLYGPFATDATGDTWQVERIGYNLPGDLGGPMNIGEEYRWNIKEVVYAYDASFIQWFGPQGVNAVEEAIAEWNALPPVSQMSDNLSEFPLDTRRINHRATAVGLFDVKSFVMAMLTEQVGLTSSERYTWCLRGRFEQNNTVQYSVIRRSFDPERNTLFPPATSYVNGTLYTYGVFEFAPPEWAITFADAVEIPVDPLAFQFRSVAGAIEDIFGASGFTAGQFFTGYTRDDVGGLRYIYRPDNVNVENLLTNTIVAASGGPWTPIGGGGTNATNVVVVSQALRAGIDKVVFRRGTFDSLTGEFVTMTNNLEDVYFTNQFGTTRQVSQSVQRVLTTPDILFAAGDLGVVNAIPVFSARSGPDGLWENNDPINGAVTQAGPGVIQPPAIISLSSIGTHLINITPDSLSQATASFQFTWGSFDGTTNAPLVYPEGMTIEDLEFLILGGF